jgi:hypothetical protein
VSAEAANGSDACDDDDDDDDDDDEHVGAIEDNDDAGDVVNAEAEAAGLEYRSNNHWASRSK